MPLNTNKDIDSASSLLDEMFKENKQEKKQLEYYQLPVQVGKAGKSLDNDEPWIVGQFSPGKATDKNHPKGHNGTDLKAPRGTPVYPIASGIVSEVGNGVISGNYVKILHEDGGVQSYYAHLDSTNTQKNDKVTKTTIIGRVGDTGNAKGRGAHLHYEVKVNGQLINPFGIAGKQVGTLSKKAKLIKAIVKFAKNFVDRSLAE